ncbi:MAG: trimethylamine methyltransferase family protein [Anaerolineae bacterium]|nr:trimethylamine methyltransferase family protein [Anaerolineae bacterium]
MFGSSDPIRLFSDDDLEALHQASLEILADPGMRIMTPALLEALEQHGARVDHAQQAVRFPSSLVERTIADMQEDLRRGRRPVLLNGVVSSRSAGPIQAKFGGACVEYLDWGRQQVRPPTRKDLIDMVRLGQALPEVTSVGNPVVYLTEDDGTPVDPRLQRIKTAALIARYTNKAGATEVWNAQELEYLIELGEIVRGSREAYLADPCFVTAKETISPLILDDKAGEVLLLLARRGLPTTIIPMPLTGASAPMSLAANVALCNAEVLGVATAVRCACPTAWVAGGVISGVLDMATGAASFAAPEAIVQDLGIAELHERRYGFDFAIGTGYTDAKYPGAQAVMEKLVKFWASYRSGRVNYPIGLVNGGKTFSPEQAMLDLEVAHWIHEFGKGIAVSEETLCVEQIRRQGIGGNHLTEDHTLAHMRRVVWYPVLMDRTLAAGLEKDRARDMVERARARVEAVLRCADWEIDRERVRAIDDVVRRAERALRQ